MPFRSIAIRENGGSRRTVARLRDAHRSKKGPVVTTLLRTYPRRNESVTSLGRASESRLNEDAVAIERRVQEFSDEELLARYHELIDKRLDEGKLSYMEIFELERLEARLDLADQGDVDLLLASEGKYERERRELLESIENLVAGLTRPRRGL